MQCPTPTPTTTTLTISFRTKEATLQISIPSINTLHPSASPTRYEDLLERGVAYHVFTRLASYNPGEKKYQAKSRYEYEKYKDRYLDKRGETPERYKPLTSVEYKAFLAIEKARKRRGRGLCGA